MTEAKRTLLMSLRQALMLMSAAIEKYLKEETV